MKFPLLAGPGAASTNEPVFSRPARTRFSLPEKPRVGIPRSPYFVSDAYRKLFAASCTHLQSLQCIQGSFDFAPFSEVASLLYQGPWTAERYAVAGKLIEQNAMGVDAVVAEVISAGKSFSAVDALNALYRLRELEAQTQPVWDEFDVLIVPTSPNLPTYAETCAAPASIPLAVVGAHLRGMPLHHQLTARGARLRAATHTAAHYRLYALNGTEPPKPALARTGDGAAIAVEVYDMPPETLGSLLADIPPPLGLGTIELSDGTWVKGFICEPRALQDARDITAFGGWIFTMPNAPL